MNGYLLDTNVLSESAKPIADPQVMLWLDRTASTVVFTTAITLGELRIGIENLPLGKRRTALEVWFATGLPQSFAAHVLPVTRKIAYRWATLTIMARRRGMTLSITDGLIAATALEYDLTLVTRNTSDFVGLGVTLLNPWEPPAL